MKIYLRIQNSYFHKGYKVNIHDYIQFNNLILIKILISLDDLNLIFGFDFFFFIYILYYNTNIQIINNFIEYLLSK